MLIILPVRFLILLTVFELLPKNLQFYHVLFLVTVAMLVGARHHQTQYILKLDTLVMIQTSLVSIGLVVSEENIFEKVYDDGRQVMAIAHLALWAR